MAAKAVAADLNAPFVDLSYLSVGSDTLTGLLARVLGWTQTPDLIKDLRSGKTALVLDGLDEAQLRAGRDHTIAFLGNVVDLVKDADASVGQIVIFGRRDAIETSYLVLSDHGIHPFMATIAPLTRSQANELIDLELDNKSVSGRRCDAHRVHRVPFGQLRDALFGEIAEALDAIPPGEGDYWDSVEDFLGYPPVLLVLAEHLAVANPSAALSEMQLNSGAKIRMRYGELLRNVVEGILDRESRKVRGQIAQSLSLGPGDPKCAVLYTREEQILRILNYSADYLNLTLLPPVVLSNGERAVYEQQISTFVPDHPFLRDRKFANVVFGDYVRAYVAAGSQIGAYGRPKAEALQACPVVGPFFAGLVHSFLTEQSRESKSSEETVAPALQGEELVDDLINSFYLGRGNGEATFFYTHSQEHASLALFGWGSNAHKRDWQGDASLYFKLENLSGVLELTTPLMQGFIVSHHGLILKSLSDEVEIGPNLVVVVSELEIEGRKLTALGGRVGDSDEPSESMLVAMRQPRHDPALTITCYPAGSLKVHWPNAGHMWRPYVADDSYFVKGDVGGLSESARWQVMVGTRRILTSFHGTIYSPSASRDRIDQYATGSNPLFVAILNGLMELGVVERSGSTYKLNLGILGHYGANYTAVRGADFTGALSKLAVALGDMEVVKGALREADE